MSIPRPLSLQRWSGNASTIWWSTKAGGNTKLQLSYFDFTNYDMLTKTSNDPPPASPWPPNRNHGSGEAKKEQDKTTNSPTDCVGTRLKKT
jgi:hypothetical protein